MSIFFEIHVDDIQRAVHFYGSLFGWVFTRNSGVPLEYMDIQSGDIRGGMLKRPAQTPPMGYGTNAFICSFETDDFDAASMKILSMGGMVALEKFPVVGRCWQGYFIDTEGNTFGIFQVDEKAGV